MSPEDEIDRAIFDALQEFGRDVVAEMQQRVGILFPPASDPFNPPHLRTGNLQQGISILSIVQEGPISTLTIISTMPYTLPLEYGRSRMLPRPFLLPTVELWAALLPQYLETSVNG